MLSQTAGTVYIRKLMIKVVYHRFRKSLSTENAILQAPSNIFVIVHEGTFSTMDYSGLGPYHTFLYFPSTTEQGVKLTHDIFLQQEMFNTLFLL